MFRTMLLEWRAKSIAESEERKRVAELDEKIRAAKKRTEALISERDRLQTILDKFDNCDQKLKKLRDESAQRKKASAELATKISQFVTLLNAKKTFSYIHGEPSTTSPDEIKVEIGNVTKAQIYDFFIETMKGYILIQGSRKKNDPSLQKELSLIQDCRQSADLYDHLAVYFRVADLDIIMRELQKLPDVKPAPMVLKRRL